MYKTHLEAAQFIEQFRKLGGDRVKGRIIGLAPPFTAIPSALEKAAGSALVIGAQNCHAAEEGAFTGEISLGMLKALGLRFVLIGHSERRTLFGETDAMVHQKLCQALHCGMTPILCIGETLEERESGNTERVLTAQLAKALEGISPEALFPLVVAYEPVWAIGTGRSATPAMAQEVHGRCRQWMVQRGGEALGARVPILYGGSVKPETIASLMLEADIDGVLVGGASLDPESFFKIAAFE